MALSVIRPFTESDKKRLNESASRFIERHSLNVNLDYLNMVHNALDMYLWEQHSDLKPLWQACKCRALRVKPAANITVGYGYIGHYVK